MIMSNIIERQIKLMGINQVIKRYSIMLDELRFAINEQVDTKRASVLSDIEEVLENILYSIKKGILSSNKPRTVCLSLFDNVHLGNIVSDFSYSHKIESLYIFR